MKPIRIAMEMAGVFRPAHIRACIKNEPPEVRRWIRRWRPAPAPPVIKLAVLDFYRARFQPSIFIETGTYEGDTVLAMQDRFRRLYTVELSRDLHQQAVARLAGHRHITALQGDSTDVLPSILKEINEPCFFWLDGHYSGGKTAKGKLNCPLLQELECIVTHPIRHHVILVDDARLLGKQEDYPTVKELAELGGRSGYISELHYDILCLTPAGSPRLGDQLREVIQ